MWDLDPGVLRASQLHQTVKLVCGCADRIAAFWCRAISSPESRQYSICQRYPPHPSGALPDVPRRPVKDVRFGLEHTKNLMRGGSTGPAIVPGNAKASLLYKLIAREAEPYMPHKSEKLSEEAVARIAEWINAGAPYNQNADLVTVSNKSTTAQPAKGDAIKLGFGEVCSVLESRCLICHGGKWEEERSRSVHAGDLASGWRQWFSNYSWRCSVEFALQEDQT